MIDINKKYRTRDGREVRIYATDGIESEEVHGSVKRSYGWCAETWPINGLHSVDSSLDLIEVRPRHKRTVWLNMYGKPDDATAYIDKWKADQSVSPRIACIKVELDFEEGEGL
jgi:hypothetical protein